MAIRGWTKRTAVVLASVILSGASLVVFGGAAGASSPKALPHDVLQVIPTNGQFPDTTLGTYTTIGAFSGPYLLNNTQTTDTIDLATDVSFSGPVPTTM